MSNNMSIGADIVVHTQNPTSDVNWVSAYLQVQNAPERSVGIACDNNLVYLLSGVKGSYAVTYVEDPTDEGSLVQYDVAEAVKALLADDDIEIDENGNFIATKVTENAKSLNEMAGEELPVGERWSDSATAGEPFVCFADLCSFLYEAYDENYAWDL